MASKRVSLKGKGADLFFGDYQQPDDVADADDQTPATDEPDSEPTLATPLPQETSPAELPVKQSTASPTTPRTRPASKPIRHQASTLASSTAIDDEFIAAIRRVVRTPGREVSYVRLSAEEKERLGEVVYTFKRQGQKLTETDISRIAVNSLLADYDRHGEASVLARVLASMRD